MGNSFLLKKILIKILIPIVIILLFFIIMTHIVPGMNESICNYHVEFEQMDINGIVTQKYIDSTQHSTPIIVVSNFNSKSITIDLFGDTSSSFDVITIGDTIYKPLYSDTLTIRNGSVITRKIDFECDN